MSDLSVPSSPSTDPVDAAARLEDSGRPEIENGSETAGASAEPAAPSSRAEEAKPAKPAKAAEGESWLETVKTIFYALLIAVVIRTFLFQPFNIPSGSMESTLLVGDYLFVEKFAYGYSRNSFPFRGWPLGQFFHGRLFGADPARGDVVVFKMPNPNSPDYNEDFIKRVIGLPGDRIQMINGVVYLNGRPVRKERVSDYVGPDEYGVVRHVARYRETLPGGKSYYVLDLSPNSNEDNTGVFIVPAGHYFMMGDNRDNSDDSRLEVGYVPAENLVGKAEFRFFSIDESAIWYEPWTWPGAIRFGRMFTLID
ncbi:MAG TPA: signal peptidase I [Rhizomicrobium sp.]|nr:signal peptidase I [Rhizomicrobium sp.]